MAKQDLIKEVYEKFFKDKTLKEVVGTVDFKEWHRYSLFNFLYMNVQAQAYNVDFQGMVKPFMEWKREGTYIKSGSVGLKVFVPCVYKREDEKTGEEREVLKGFVQKPVFDISQTDNKEYEEYKKRKEVFVYDNDIGLDYEEVKIFIEGNFKEGQRLEEDFKEQECKGSFNPMTKIIRVYKKCGHTLLHEFAHSITQDLKEDINEEYAYNEVVAEITAFLIGQKLGAKGYNFNYSNIWASRIKEKDFNSFIKIFNKIDKKIKALCFDGIVYKDTNKLNWGTS